VQVNTLGYPGTMGADYIDYILADRIIIPETQFDFYNEKVVWLPDCYQVKTRRGLPATSRLHTLRCGSGSKKEPFRKALLSIRSINWGIR
jgi:hypothetical protein